jgi:brefeldin A-inhibited guanine nucleotide-exchange protein
MTKEQYINMNRGINDQGDLPDEFLSQIYDDIAANEIKTNPSNLKRPKLSMHINFCLLEFFYLIPSIIDTTNINLRQKRIYQNLELESIAQVAHSLMEEASYSLCGNYSLTIINY